MKRFMVAALTTLGLVLGTVSPAVAAIKQEHVSGVRQHVLGGCTHNRVTHELVCITGTYEFHRKVRFRDGSLHRKAFWGITVSEQRCTDHCWGPIIAGRQHIPFHIGRKGASYPVHTGTGRTEGSACPSYLFALCWVTTQEDKTIHAIDTHVIGPCVFGSASGTSSAIGWNLLVKQMLDGGVITEAQAASRFVGPEWFAAIAFATCTGGVWKKGLDSAQSLIFK